MSLSDAKPIKLISGIETKDAGRLHSYPEIFDLGQFCRGTGRPLSVAVRSEPEATS